MKYDLAQIAAKFYGSQIPRIATSWHDDLGADLSQPIHQYATHHARGAENGGHGAAERRATACAARILGHVQSFAVLCGRGHVVLLQIACAAERTWRQLDDLVDA